MGKMFSLSLWIYLLSTTFGTVVEHEFGNRSEGFTSFVNTFQQIFENTDDLKYIFSQASKEAGNHDAIYNTMLIAATEYNAADPQIIATAIADATLSAADKLTPTNLAKILAVALGQTLDDRHLITTANAAELAAKLSSSNLDDERFVKPVPAPYMKALSNGALEAVKFLNITSTETSADFTQYLVKGWNELSSA